MSPIIDIQKRLVEVGRIRMGNKSAKGAPQKLEVFRITSRDQARLAEIAAVYGGEVVPWAERAGEFEVITKSAELPILLLPGQALSQWYEMWSAGGCQRRCDGVTDVISDRACQCPPDPDERSKLAAKGKACKPTTRLSVMLPEIPGLGVWRLESHGYYAAVELAATAGMLEQATAHGQVFPARLRIDQRHQVKDGKTTRYAVPVIDIDVRLPEALGGGTVVQPALERSRPEGLPSGYTPIAQIEAGGVTVGEGLDAVAREAAPRIPNGRSAAPVGPAPDDVDFDVSEPIPVEQPEPVDAPAAVEEEPAISPVVQPPANVEGKATVAQVKKLNVLVGKLRDSGRIKTEHLWYTLAKARSFEFEQMIELLGGVDEDGVLHWAPLRDSLTKPEATELIDRLTKLEAAEEPVAA